MAKKASKQTKIATKTKTKKKNGRPTLGNFCPLLACGKTHRGYDDWRLVAGDGVLVHIRQEHIDKAVRAGEHSCVVALAFAELFGPSFDISVGVSVTKVISQKDKVELRLKTPPAIGRTINVWDHKKGWNLPVGIYRFSKYKVTGKRRKVSAAGKYKGKEDTTRPTVYIKNSKKRTSTTIRNIVRNARLKLSSKKKK